MTIEDSRGRERVSTKTMGACMTKITVWVAASVLALGGCGPADDDDREGGAPPETAAPGAPAPDDPVARWAALVPDSVRHRRGACPFECCVYRDWTPTGDVALRPRPSQADPTGVMIPPGETFTADSGFVQVTGISLIEVTDSVMAGPPGSPPFGPGDTLVVLDYVGEGFWNVWDGERVIEISGFWGAEVFPSQGNLLAGDRYAREWWVHATTRTGEKGWFNADSVARISGVDACGGP